MKRIITAFASSALILGSIGLAGPAVAAPAAPAKSINTSIPAAKAKVPKIVNATVKTTRTPKPKASVQKVTLPVLQNSTEKNHKAFAKYANALVNAELKPFKVYLGGCEQLFTTKPLSTGIYKGRYASVTMRTSTYNCGATSDASVNSFTMDLRTGKKVDIWSFVAQDHITTKTAVVSNFYAAKNKCIDDLSSAAPKGVEGYVPRPAAWTVTSKGIKFHFAKYSIGAGYCDIPGVVLPWAEVATAKQLKGAVKNRIYTTGIKYDKKNKMYLGNYIVTGVQGRKVTYFEGYPDGIGDCMQGVRSGKTATLGYQWGSGKKYKLKLKDTSSNPKVDVAKFGKGWHEATAADLKQLKAAWGGKAPSTQSVCG